MNIYEVLKNGKLTHDLELFVQCRCQLFLALESDFFCCCFKQCSFIMKKEISHCMINEVTCKRIQLALYLASFLPAKEKAKEKRR